MRNARRITRRLILATLLMLQLATWVQELNMYWFYKEAVTNWQFLKGFIIPVWYIYVYPLAIFAALKKWPDKVELLLVFLAIHWLKQVPNILLNEGYIMYYMIHAAKIAAAISIVMSIAIFVNYYLIWTDWNGRNKRK